LNRVSVLPIADRELRVAARSKATHRLRILFATGAVLIAGAIALISLVSKGALAGQLGIFTFDALKWMAFVFACGAGTFLTADCLSEEKRDGTLGLIFLTDLRGHDVVLGKLFATSLRSFYSLLAIFPVMAFSFCLGGVAADDFSHSLIAICNALFFSLALGMMISVVSRDSHKAMSGTLAAMCLCLFLVPQLDYWLPSRPGGNPWLALLSPAYSFTHTTLLNTSDYWVSTALVNAAGWVFLGVASWLAPRTWHEKSPRRKGVAIGRLPFFDTARARARIRGLLEINPAAWIIARDRWASGVARLVLLLVLATFALSMVTYSLKPGASPLFRATTTARTVTTTNSSGVITSSTTSVQVGAPSGIGASPLFTIGVWLAGVFGIGLEFWLLAQVCRFYVDGKKNGFLELMFVSPVRPPDIIRGHWLALRKLFLGPVMALMGLELIGGIINLAAMTAFGMSVVAQVTLLVIGQVAWITGLGALVWYAIWMGVASNKTSVAMLKAFVCVKVLPLFGVYFVMGISAFFVSRIFGPSLIWLISIIPQALLIVVNFILIAGARRMAQRSLSGRASC
jgi:hypothetical protein